MILWLAETLNNCLIGSGGLMALDVYIPGKQYVSKTLKNDEYGQEALLLEEWDCLI